MTMPDSDIFVEMECSQLNHEGELVCGDVFKFLRFEAEQRHLAVLSDGLGSGIKANLQAGLTTTMALEFVRSDMDILRSAEIIMDTLPVCEVRKISYATFTIFDLQIGGRTRVIEMDNPPFIHLRNGEDMPVERRTLVSERWPERRVHVSELKILPGDRLIAFSDGVTQAGLGQPESRFGWRREGALEFIRKMVREEKNISARDLSRIVTLAARSHNSGSVCYDDISCMVIYLREPRRLRLFTGPPFNKESDSLYPELINDFKGRVIIAGGTTANIISRELKVPVQADIKLVSRAGGLPPPAEMEGIDLVCEGILTLTWVAQQLESDSPVTGAMPMAAREMIELFRASDEIEFVVGTRVNEAHQDPNLPMDLEMRRNIVRRLKNVLEQKFRKRVFMRFL